MFTCSHRHSSGVYDSLPLGQMLLVLTQVVASQSLPQGPKLALRMAPAPSSQPLATPWLVSLSPPSLTQDLAPGHFSEASLPHLWPQTQETSFPRAPGTQAPAASRSPNTYSLYCYLL